ncbi:hypothetical protein [Candidatus Accumulibacter sp. ACC003]|uniref:hypothetical protein n=1 Tax=Candidatus Accumulibacter sp. ACC003 TaxID=2823334 RepID=UPI0025C1DE5B|nr:hypothetical protein [Candidatus Accumulibacter sp. ACC003]
MHDIAQSEAWLSSEFARLLHWLEQDILVWSTVEQLSIVLTLLLVARIVARRSADWFEGAFKRSGRKSIIRLHVSSHELFFVLFVILFIWLALTGARAAAQPHQILRMFLSLAVAWGIIRFSSSTIQNPFWSQLLAGTLWTLAALNIIDWLDPSRYTQLTQHNVAARCALTNS